VGLEGFEYYMPRSSAAHEEARPRLPARWPWTPRSCSSTSLRPDSIPIIAAGIDQLILELKRAFRMTIIVVTHELASAFLTQTACFLIDKGNIVALGTVTRMRASTQPRVRQFLDASPSRRSPERWITCKWLTAGVTSRRVRRKER